MALKYISSTISETDGHVFYDNHDLDRVIWVDPQEGSHVVWERQQPSEWKGLRILPTGDNMVSVRLVVNGTPGTINPIYYSGDQGVTWNELTETLSAEYSEIWLKSYNPTGLGAVVQSGVTYTLQSWNSIYCTGESYVTGNITSLLDTTGDLTDLSGCDEWCFAGVFKSAGSNLIGYDCFYPTILCKGCYLGSLPVTAVYCSSLPATILAEACYYSMFQNCYELEYAPYLNATTLYEYCYAQMFINCRSLIESPILPATNLAHHCYYNMFGGCLALVNAPALPATTLSSNCYDNMFFGCRSLISTPSLSATLLASGCYYGMFGGCASLVTAPELPATTLFHECYAGMFTNCTSLVDAPTLPATNLATYCYSNMFSGCTSLVTAPELPATNISGSCYLAMFQGCTSLVTAPELPATTLSNYCYDFMFEGCTSLQVAPILPAEILTPGCYYRMFNGCSSLNTIICLATDRSAEYSTTDWCIGVPEVGDFYCPSEVTPQWVEWDASNIPPYWTRHSTDKVIIYGYSEHGTVTGSGTYNIGDSVTLTFTPSQGYVFDHWEYIDGTTASTDNPYTFTASENLVLKAVTEYARYTIDAGALNGVVAATVGGVGVQLPYTGAYGTVVRLYAQPTEGHEFWFWDDGSTDNPYDVTLDADKYLYAICVSTDMEYWYLLRSGVSTYPSPFVANFFWSGSVSDSPNLEYSIYNEETQGWGDWTTLTFEPYREGVVKATYSANYARMRGANPDGFHGRLRTGFKNMGSFKGTVNALLYNGVAVRTLTQEYCFANMFRTNFTGYPDPEYAGVTLFGSDFLPATTLSPHCYDGMFAIDVGSAQGSRQQVQVFLPATNLAEGCYNNLIALFQQGWMSRRDQCYVYYYGPSQSSSSMNYYADNWFGNCVTGAVHVKVDVDIPQPHLSIPIIHDLA